jgi:transcriptional antiterminator NusG
MTEETKNETDLVKEAAGELEELEEKTEEKKEEKKEEKEPEAIEELKEEIEEVEEKKEEQAEEKAEEKKKPEEPVEEKEEKPEGPAEEKKEEEAPAAEPAADEPFIFALRTTANREDQVMDFLSSNVTKKGLNVFSITRPHGMRGYIFMEAATQQEAEQAAHGIPYARGILPKAIDYSEMEHMVEPVKRELTIKKNDIVEIISGPFKRETAKITRIDEQKEEVVVELVEAAVPIPITLKIDAVKVIRRDTDEETE